MIQKIFYYLFWDIKYLATHTRILSTLTLILNLLTKSQIFNYILELLYVLVMFMFVQQCVYFMRRNYKKDFTENVIKLIYKIFLITCYFFTKIKLNLKNILFSIFYISIYSLFWNIEKIYNINIFEFIMLYILVLIICNLFDKRLINLKRQN